MKEFRKSNKTCGCKGSNPFTSKTETRLAETIKTDDKSLEFSLPGTTIHTLEQLVEKFKVDLSVWEVERFIANKWEVVMKPAAYTELFTVQTATKEGTVKNTVPLWQRDKENVDPLHRSLYQVKAFFKKRVEVVDAKNELEGLKELAKKNAPKPLTVKLVGSPNGNMLEVNLPDPHFGKLAWGAETGGANYDTKIAVDVYRRAVQALLERTASYGLFEEILFVVGNDLLNSDDLEGRTTKGTYVSTDGRYQKTFSAVRTLIIETIETLRTRAKKVKVMMVPGNHDRLSTWHLGDSLECYFHKYEDVEIDNSARYRKYYQFGKVMIMFTHGDKGKRVDYPLLMATEQREMFGNTEFREAHIGHKHTNKVEEFHGVRVRTLSALCPPDAWHSENGFCGNLRSSEAFVWNAVEGLIGIAVYTDSDELIHKSVAVNKHAA